MNAHLNQAYVSEGHRIPLETAVAGSLAGRAQLVSSLYKEALDLFYNRKSDTPKLIRTRQESADPVTDAHTISASVTDEETGIFVQLTGQASGLPKTRNLEAPLDASKLLLTFGKKFVMEFRPAQLSNTAMKIWR